MARIGHLKSRNGCKICKKRRVKCDEKVPCTACVRHGKHCSLLDGPDSSDVPSVRASRLTQRPRLARPVLEPQPASSGRPNTAAPMPIVLGNFGFNVDVEPHGGAHDSWAQDLELMHHYTAHTYASFAVIDEVEYVFREVIPSLAFGYPYLLHSILAISAFHIAYKHPNCRERYMLRGSYHQSQSIPGIRRALGEEIKPETSHVIVMASGFLMAGMLASHRDCEDLPGNPTRLEAMLGIISHLRGMAAVSRMLCRQPPQPLYEGSEGDHDDPAPAQSITERLRWLESEGLAQMNLESGEEAVIKGAVSSFVWSMSHFQGQKILLSPKLRAIFLWPIKMSNEYIFMLRSRHPAALLIFLYYSLVLKSGASYCWFLQGWGLRLVEENERFLRHEPWLGLSRWPLERIKRSS